MKRILNGVLVFLISMLVSVTVNAAEVNEEAELVSCIEIGGTCVLNEDIKLSSNANQSKGIIITKDVIIDLNGHSISTDVYSNGLFTITKGNVKFTGKGSLISNTEQSVGIRIQGAQTDQGPNYTVVTLDKNVTLSAPFAAFITHNNKHAYGAVLNVYGTINGRYYYGLYVNGSNQDIEGNVPQINVYDGAKIYALESTFDGDGMAVYAAGYAKYNFGAATFEGIGNAIGIKAGVLTLNGSKLTAKGEDKSESVPEYSNGINSSGAALQIETNDNYADHVEIYVNDATITSMNGYAVLEYLGKTNIKKMEIKSGTFTSKKGYGIFKVSKNFNATKFISGGTYSADLDKSYLQDKYLTVRDGDNYVVVTEGDYTKVDEAIKKAEDINLSLYTEKSVKALEDAIKSVDRKLYSNSQSKIDAMADAINKAVKELVKLGVDVVEESKSLDKNSKKIELAAEIDEKVQAMLIESRSKELQSKIDDAISEGKTVTTKVFVEIIEDESKLSDEAKADIKKIKDNLSNDLKVVNFMDLELQVFADDELIGNITETKKTLTYEVVIPEYLLKSNREFTIIRNHNGKVEKLKTTLKDNILSFETNKYSTYLLAYKDVDGTKLDDVPKTGETIITVISVSFILLAGFFGFIKYKKYLV